MTGVEVFWGDLGDLIRAVRADAEAACPDGAQAALVYAMPALEAKLGLEELGALLRWNGESLPLGWVPTKNSVAPLGRVGC